NDRIVKLHFDTKAGGTTNAIWGGATLHANCSADYSIAFKTVDNSVSFNNGGTGSWTTQTPGVGELTFNKSTVNNLIEFKIKRTLIEATTSFKFAMFVGQDWSPFHVGLGLPEGSFTDADGSVTFTKYMEFDLTSESDPITQSPIKP
ncbi:MAG TPA: hypothetical protein PLO89_07550, partial [Spirochaetota bacterium]|nr:hypothetical protein [Spirochaetota bacterium]